MGLVLRLPKLGGKPGPQWTKPHELIADKAYDDDALRTLLRWMKIQPGIPRRGEKSLGLGCKRWPIERTFAWLRQFGRLRYRLDRRSAIYETCVTISLALICWRKLIN